MLIYFYFFIRYQCAGRFLVLSTTDLLIPNPSRINVMFKFCNQICQEETFFYLMFLGEETDHSFLILPILQKLYIEL